MQQADLVERILILTGQLNEASDQIEDLFPLLQRPA